MCGLVPRDCEATSHIKKLSLVAVDRRQGGRKYLTKDAHFHRQQTPSGITRRNPSDPRWQGGVLGGGN